MGEPLPSYREREEVEVASSATIETLPELTPYRPMRLLLLVPIILILVSVVAIISVPGIVHYSAQLSPDQRETAIASFRSTLVQLFAALAIIGGLYFTVQTLILGRQNAAANIYSQVAERYAKSLELIATSNDIGTRLGGLMALARIGRVSSGDRSTIARYLAALIRLSSDHGGNDRRSSAELSTILSTLGDLRGDGYSARYDLRSTCLTDLDDETLRLGATNLNGATVSRSRILHSTLSNSTAVRATFTHVDLRFSVLTQLLARDATFDQSDLSWCELTDSVFIGASLRGVSLVGSRLAGSIFIGSNLSNADLRRTDLSATNLSDCILAGAYYDDDTDWPPGFDIASSGARLG
jgi:uncharacterized protein YjbI with pentapeptide repeats